jgi:hypothetical protein
MKGWRGHLVERCLEPALFCHPDIDAVYVPGDHTVLPYWIANLGTAEERRREKSIAFECCFLGLGLYETDL